MASPYFTIGHYNHSLQEFVLLLTGAGVQRLVDVRKLPGSRANPQFDGSALQDSLAPFQISYCRIASLGGLRGKRSSVPASVNGYWTNQSFHNYADYALSAEFQDGLAELLSLGAHQRCAIMCAEAVWWRCHRRIISDYLITRGMIVIHIMGEGRLEPAQLSSGAVLQADGRIDYPAISEAQT